MTAFFVLPPYRDGVPRPPNSIRAVGHALSTELIVGFIFGWTLLGLVSLVLNYVHTRDSEACRKLRIMFWGTVVGVAPIAVEQAYEGLTGTSVPRWLLTALILLASLFPLSFAYAVVKHRVLEIPVLLKRSARYLLVQRGFTFLLSGASIAATLVFASWLNSFLVPNAQVSQAWGVAIGAIFGTALLWGGAQNHRKVSGRIDHAFFPWSL